MLEIRDLTKVYTTKGVSVRALDGVSLRFPEKGMVFLLGKSGSGKSTLLNLCGGLDTPDSGEIVIKGRSSKDFTQSDFDSYRNTFIGFVFQEYNILNEFSVEDNIALALELQGKSKDRARVQEILRQVELEQFARRKPNTLSGGQKQRVAIARALVKNPEIIMADEPTGALDSKTGKQVFDTLKKLSGSKLVIVVSHDREFAEVYGDRIIELKDGKVISDVTKEKIQPTRESDNLTFIGEDTISVQDGSRLTDADMGRIRAFLSKVRGRVLLTGGEKEIADFKKAARIDDSGARETFAETNEAAIPAGSYTEADSRFIRSKLPVRHAVRIGASSMRIKPFRLFFTILLSFIAFTMFGLFSTLTFYDEKSVLAESYLGAGYDTVVLQKDYRYDNVSYDRESGDELSRYTSYDSANFTSAELAGFRSAYGRALGMYNFSSSGRYFSVENLDSSQLSGMGYYRPYIYNFAEGAADFGVELLTPETDLSSLEDDEIVISSFLFDSFRRYKLTEASFDEYGNLRTGDPLSLDTVQDIVGKTVVLYGNGGRVLLTVRGVFRADPPEKFDVMKEATQVDYTLNSQFGDLLSRELPGAVLVSDGFYDAHKADFSSRSESMDEPDYLVSLETELSFQFTIPDYMENTGYLRNIAPLTQQSLQDSAWVYWVGSDKTSLSDNEILLNASSFDIINFIGAYANNTENELQSAYHAEYDRLYEIYYAENWETFRQNYFDARYNEYLSWDYSEEDARLNAEQDTQLYAKDDFDGMAHNEIDPQAWQKQNELYDAIQSAVGVLYEPFAYAPEEVQAAAQLLFPYLDDACEKGLLPAELPLINAAGTEAGTYTVAGYIYAPYTQAMFSEKETERLSGLYGSPTFYRTETNYVRSADEKYGIVLMPMPDRAGLTQIVNGSSVYDENDTAYKLVSLVADTLNGVNAMIGTLSQVFLWVGVVMAVFSMLLLFNFISVSITNKKREIGILRAVGARSADVFRIFFSESAIISAVCFVLSVIASIVVCGVLNNVLAADLGASIFVFGPLSVLALLGIAVVTSFIATFLPVYGIARKKPVESIRAL